MHEGGREKHLNGTINLINLCVKADDFTFTSPTFMLWVSAHFS